MGSVEWCDLLLRSRTSCCPPITAPWTCASCRVDLSHSGPSPSRQPHAGRRSSRPRPGGSTTLVEDQLTGYLVDDHDIDGFAPSHREGPRHGSRARYVHRSKRNGGMCTKFHLGTGGEPSALDLRGACSRASGRVQSSSVPGRRRTPQGEQLHKSGLRCDAAVSDWAASCWHFASVRRVSSPTAPIVPTSARARSSGLGSRA